MMIMRRVLVHSFVVAVGLACVPGGGKLPSAAPQVELEVAKPMVRPTELALPMHAAAIVDLGFVEPTPAGRWRLMSVDAKGWLRVWQDGKLVMATAAHHGGATALVFGPEGIPFSAGMDGRLIEWSRDGERIERVLVAYEPSRPPAAPTAEPAAEPASPPATEKPRPRPIIALAIERDQLAISDGHWVQVWSREPTPTLLWSHHSRAFVTGLALARDGTAIAMAMLREQALNQGIAEHPAAEYDKPRVTRRDEARVAEQADALELIRLQARVDRPGATADRVEVHGLPAPDSWDIVLDPLAPIDADMAMPEPGLLIYREIYSPEQTRVIGRSIGDELHLGVRVGVISTPPGPEGQPAGPDPSADSSEGLADFAFGRGIDAQQAPIGMRLEPYDSLPIAGRRELAIGNEYWAAGDEHGQLVIGPRAGGELEWLPAAEPIELIAASPGGNQPYLVTSGLEQPIRIRRWQLAEGQQRLVGMILPPLPNPETGVVPPALYPVELAIDDSGNRVAVSSWSFSAELSGDVRLFDLAAGTAKVVEQTPSPSGLEIALAGDGTMLWSWHEGSLARSFAAPDWGSTTTQGLGRPQAASDQRWMAFVNRDRRQIFDRQNQVFAQDQRLEIGLPSEFVSALASDGTLAVVVPLGGGTIERLHPSEGVLPPITTFGPVTALAWIAGLAGQSDGLLIGQAEGSIDLLEPGASEPRPLRPAEGGRVWALAAVGGSQSGFVELDDEGLWIHRVSDGASLSVMLASPEPRVTKAQANSTPVGPSQGLVVVWRASTGAAVCRVFDATGAGVVGREGLAIERDQPTLLGEFLAGEVACGPPPPTNPELVLDATW